MNNGSNSSTTELFPNKDTMKGRFESTAAAKNLVARDIVNQLGRVLSVLVAPPAIKVRIKRFDSYYKKYLNLLKEGQSVPLITDLIGLRVICPFMEDLSLVENLIKENFDVTEVEKKGHYTYKEFGYESTHLLIKIPADIRRERDDTGCDVAEIQIRTILQDAWAEVEHELTYKSEFNPFDTPMRRKLAALNASLSLADIVFQEIRVYQRDLAGQLGKRRKSFYEKIEESTDALLFSESPIPNEKPKNGAPQGIGLQGSTLQGSTLPHSDETSSIDDLLLRALTAHNNKLFEDAVTLYSRILELKPEENIRALIFKHRGMAHFARSEYQAAIEDFTNALQHKTESYKASYYRGVVYSVLKQYSQAIDDYTKSLETNPYQAFCLFRRGQAYYHIGDYPQALSDCEVSLSMEPGNKTAQNFRTMLQNKLKM
jgi:putative GTP pyrophosphokinase